MEITVTVSEEIGQRLRSAEKHLPEILAIGLRAWEGQGNNVYTGLAEVLEILARLPGPEEVLALRPSPALEERLDYLLERNQTHGLSEEERREWEQYEYVEYLVQIAKARAARVLEGK